MCNPILDKTLRAVFIMVLSTFMLVACGGGGGGGGGIIPPPPADDISLNVTTIDLLNVPDHAPYTFKQTPYGFSQVKMLPDGRIVGNGRLEASEIPRLFSVTPGQAGFNFMTPNEVSGGQFSYRLNRAVFQQDSSLFTINAAETQVKISGNEKVEAFWLSENETKAFFFANSSWSQIRDEATGRDSSVRRNQLFMVDLVTGTRVLLEANSPGSLVAGGASNGALIHASGPRLLPDESRVVYVVINQISRKIALRSVKLDGTEKVVLDDNMMAETPYLEFSVGRVFMYAFSPDSSRVVYRVMTENEMALYSIAPDGGQKVNISPYIQLFDVNETRESNLLISQSKSTLKITADSTRVLFLARPNGAESSELHSAQLDGSGLVNVSSSESVSGFTLSSSPQNNVVIYATANKVFSAAVTGGVATELNGNDNWRAVNELTLIDNDQTVVYAARDRGTSNLGLYLSTLDGAATIDLTNIGGTDGGVQWQGSIVNSFMIDPAGEYLVYRANTEDQTDVGAMFRVKLDGTERIKITPDKLFSRRNYGQLIGFADNRLYFYYSKNRDRFEELFSFDMNNLAITNISATWPAFTTEDARSNQYVLAENSAVEAFTTSTYTNNAHAIQVITPLSDCQILAPEGAVLNQSSPAAPITSDGEHLYYRLYGAAGVAGLYKASTRTCDSVAIDVSNRSIRAMKLSPDGKDLVYVNGDSELFLTASDGTSTQRLNAEPSSSWASNNGRGDFAISPDASHVIFWASERSGTTNNDLYSVTRDGATVNRINPAIQQMPTWSRRTFTPKIANNNQWVVYGARLAGESLQLYKSRLDGSENGLLSAGAVNSSLSTGGRYGWGRITDDSTKVVYLTRPAGTFRNVIHVSNLEGDPSTIQLTPASTQQRGGVLYHSEILLTSDSRTAVYVSQEIEGGSSEIYAAKLDGSGVVQLTQPIASGASIANYRISITADNSQVVYFASTYNPEATALHVSNLDGGGKILLQDNVFRGSAKPILAGNGRVLFRAVINDVNGIYIQSLAGGAAALVYEIPAGRQINNIFLDGNNRVNVFGDLRQFGVMEKFSFDL